MSSSRGAEHSLESLIAGLPLPLKDLSVSLGRVGEAPVDLPHRGVLWRGGRGRFWLGVPEVARYLVEDGERLTVEAVPGADPREVARHAAVTPAVAAFLQRGLPVLKAAVAIGPAGAVVLAGDSGVGKSVLLSRLLDRGWRMLADDMAVLSRVEACGVQALPIAGTDEATLISSVWLLGMANEPGITTGAVAGAERFSALTAAAYNSRIAAALLDRRAHLSVLGALAASDAPIQTLVRPATGWTAGEVAARVA